MILPDHKGWKEINVIKNQWRRCQDTQRPNEGQTPRCKWLHLGLVLAGILATAFNCAHADFIAVESFEMDSPSEIYTDPQDPSVDHALENGPRNALVVSDGWSAWYRNTRNGVGLTDGDVFGVGHTGVTAWANGTQGYRITDTDGAVDLHFDLIFGANTVHFSLFVANSNWESNDLLQIAWGNQTILDTEGLDIDDLDVEGKWLELTATSSQAESLRITVDTNAADEGVYLDHIRWSHTVPNPGGLALIALSMLRSRRRTTPDEAE